MNTTRCTTCGQKLPEWDDLPAAIESAMTLPDIPPGLRPMLIQTVNELRMLWDVAQQHGYKKRVGGEPR